MITTLQLGARLLRYYRGITALHDLPAPEAVALVDAINLGLGQFLSKLPDFRLVTPFSAVLHAPVDLPISIVSGAKGFSYVNPAAYPVAGYASEADAVGHSCVVSGDGQLNLLNRNSELLAGYLGTTGEPTLTVFGDAVNLGENDMRISSEVKIIDASGQWETLRARGEMEVLYRSHATASVVRAKPEYWWLSSHLGNERTTSPLWHLRVWPLPASSYSISCDIKSFPASLVFEDLYTARSLPTTAEEEALLVALIAPGLKTSAFLAEHLEKADLDRAALSAMARLDEMRMSPRTATPNLSRTKRHF